MPNRLLCILCALAFLGQAHAGTLDQLSGELSDVYKQLAPSVVVVTVERDPRTIEGLPREVERALRSPETGGITVPDEQGSGIILDGDGTIVTNKHVIENALPGRISVRLADQRDFPAKLLGYDTDTDLALLKINAKGLKPAVLADSSEVQVGQIVGAIGSPYKLPSTFTVGVISAVGRTDITDAPHYEEYIQTDAAIHPGNSGGPLADIRGRVIGVNTLINGINRGLGFAVPSNVVRDVASQIKQTGFVSRPWLGAEVTSIRAGSPYARYYAPLKSGAVVVGVAPNSPAADAGVLPGDVIVKAGRVAVTTAREIQKELLNYRVGANVPLIVVRGGKELTLDVALVPKAQEALTGDGGNLVPLPPLIDDPNRPLGLKFENGTLVVKEVLPGTMASTASVQVGDTILAVEGRPVKSEEDVMRQISSSNLKKGAMLLIARGGRKGFVIINSW